MAPQKNSASEASKEVRGGRRYLPYAFTELGVAMLSSVLNSAKAIETNMAILRTFVRLRHFLATHEELANQLDDVRWRQDEQGQQIEAIFEVIERLVSIPETARRRIGYPNPGGA